MDSFTALAVVLTLTAVFSYFNERVLGLQQTIGLMVIALVFTLVLTLLKYLGLTEFFTDERSLVSSVALDETLLNGVLCFMLFSGSINVKAQTLGEERWVILALAVGATLIAAILIGVTVWGALAALGVGIGIFYALVFGALISPTDPIAALAILGKVGLPPRLEAIINGESLFNDGVGVVIFTIALTVASGTAQPTVIDAILLFLREVFGGIGLGLIASAIMHAMLTRTSDYSTQVLISLSIVALAYVIAEHIEVSGPIAMVVTGLFIGNVTIARLGEIPMKRFKTFWEAADNILNSMLFVLIGLHLVLIPSGSPFLPIAILAIAICLAARWISVFIPLQTLSALEMLRAHTIGVTNLLTWGGLRGGLAIAMALSLPESPERDAILHMTYGVVAFSIIVQGLSVGRIFSTSQLNSMLKD